MKTLTVVTAPTSTAGYPVVMGREVWGQLLGLLPAKRHGVAIISEDRVWPLWGEALLTALTGEPLVKSYLFPAGEPNKSRETKAFLEDRLLGDALGRDVVLIGLGGGVVTDLTGFVAATYLRGVAYVSLPTTLLAMVDAALGGKTGVNTPAGKNLVGAFHQPVAVLADLRTLDTLPEDELDQGLAETVKHAVLADASLLDLLQNEAASIRARAPQLLLDIVSRSASIKAELVARDVLDHGLRQALNFGHTVGHALEKASGLVLSHGHAVALGMCVEADAAVAAGVLRAQVRDRLVETLEALGLPTRISLEAGMDTVISAMRVDKKNRLGEIRFALPRGVGSVATFGGRYTTTLPEGAITEALRARQ